jgi:predicted RNA-binding Zn ribbon-like protein
MVGTSQRPVLRFDDGGWTEAVGNHPALDLVNTVAWRLDPDRTVDRLDDGRTLVRWAAFVGLVDDGQAARFTTELANDPDADRRIVAQVRHARERLYRVVQPLAVGGEPAGPDLAALHRDLLGALARAEVGSVMPLEWTTGLRSVSDLPDELALATWRLLQHEDRRHLRQCRASDCGWLFLDRTKNGSRVWCSSADCGNRTRARRHYQRHYQRHTEAAR